MCALHMRNAHALSSSDILSDAQRAVRRRRALSVISDRFNFLLNFLLNIIPGYIFCFAVSKRCHIYKVISFKRFVI